MEELLEAQAKKSFLLGFGIHSCRDGMNKFHVAIFMIAIFLKTEPSALNQHQLNRRTGV